ncbi:MFS transporter [Candidatus Nomurabacteria bacterium]|nr:MFS transporter [Candidatus Nomurabacteria bacterium]
MNHNRKIIYVASFFFSIPVALTAYINSSFLENYTDAKYVGLIYIIASIITILGLLEMPRVLTSLGNRKTSLILSIIAFLSFLFLAFGKNYFIILVAFVVYFAVTNFLFMSLDIFIEDFSKDSAIGRFRGFYLTIIGVAWVLAQMVSGSIINKSSYSGIYLYSAFFMVLVSVIFTFFLKNFEDPKYKKISIPKTFRFFIENKNISKIYLVNLILKFFFAWMIIYTPIYLHEHLLLSWDKIGFIFTIMLLPFILLEFPLGKLSDKMGEKKILIWGFIITTLTTMLIPFITTPRVWLLALILFSTRVGAATIEVMSESYFFKKVHEENTEAISFFRNTGPLSFIIAPLCATLTLMFIPSFKYLFFVLSTVLLLGLLLTLKLRDVK